MSERAIAIVVGALGVLWIIYGIAWHRGCQYIHDHFMLVPKNSQWAEFAVEPGILAQRYNQDELRRLVEAGPVNKWDALRNHFLAALEIRVARDTIADLRR